MDHLQYNFIYCQKYHLYNLWRKSVKELKNKNGNPLLYSNYKEYHKSLKGIIKTGIVSPVYKKGNPQQFDNYRPISTLLLFSKVFEKLIYKRI